MPTLRPSTGSTLRSSNSGSPELAEHGDKVKAVMPVHIGGQASTWTRSWHWPGSIAGDRGRRSPRVPDDRRERKRHRERAQVAHGRLDRARHGVQLLCHQDHRHRRRRHADNGRRPNGGAGPPDAAARRQQGRLEFEALRRCHPGITKFLLRASNTISPMSRRRLAWCNCRRGQSCRTGGWRLPGETAAAFAGQAGLEQPVLRHPDHVCAWTTRHRAAESRPAQHRPRSVHSRELDVHGVGCSVHFIPLHLQPYGGIATS